MSKKNKRNEKPQQPKQTNQITEQENVQTLKWRKIEVKFRTKSQEQLWQALDKNEITFVSGPAGTGKTYISIIKSIELLSKENSPYKKIIIIKPVVEADEKLGALPGTIDYSRLK